MHIRTLHTPMASAVLSRACRLCRFCFAPFPIQSAELNCSSAAAARQLLATALALSTCPNTGQVLVQGAKVQKHWVALFGQARLTTQHVAWNACCRHKPTLPLRTPVVPQRRGALGFAKGRLLTFLGTTHTFHQNTPPPHSNNDPPSPTKERTQHPRTSGGESRDPPPCAPGHEMTWPRKQCLIRS